MELFTVNPSSKYLLFFLTKNICFSWIEQISSFSSMYFLIQLFTIWINWTFALITGAEFGHIDITNSISYALLKIIEVSECWTSGMSCNPRNMFFFCFDSIKPADIPIYLRLRLYDHPSAISTIFCCQSSVARISFMRGLHKVSILSIICPYEIYFSPSRQRNCTLYK